MNTTTRNMLAVPVINRSLGKDEGEVIAVRSGVERAVHFPAKFSGAHVYVYEERRVCCVNEVSTKMM